MISDDAAARLKEIEKRLEEIREEIDIQDAWDPNTETSDREKELREERDALLREKRACESILNDGPP